MYSVFRASQSFLYEVSRETDHQLSPNRIDCAAVILYTAERATRMALDTIQVTLIIIFVINVNLDIWW